MTIAELIAHPATAYTALACFTIGTVAMVALIVRNRRRRDGQ